MDSRFEHHRLRNGHIIDSLLRSYHFMESLLLTLSHMFIDFMRCQSAYESEIAIRIIRSIEKDEEQKNQREEADSALDHDNEQERDDHHTENNVYCNLRGTFPNI